MIVKMKKIFLFAPDNRKRELLKALRSFGLMHIEEKKHAKSDEALLCQKDMETLDACLKLFAEIRDKNKNSNKKGLDDTKKLSLNREEILKICSKVLALKDRRGECLKALEEIRKE